MDLRHERVKFIIFSSVTLMQYWINFTAINVIDGTFPFTHHAFCWWHLHSRHLLAQNNRSIITGCERCSKLTIKTPERNSQTQTKISFPGGNYMFKVNNRRTRTIHETCSKLTASFWCLLLILNIFHTLFYCFHC